MRKALGSCTTDDSSPPSRPFVTSVPYLRAETEFIMENRFALVRARRCERMNITVDSFRTPSCSKERFVYIQNASRKVLFNNHFYTPPSLTYRRVAEMNPQFRCVLSGAPAVDAVRLKDSAGANAGRLAMEKAAIVWFSEEAVKDDGQRDTANEKNKGPKNATFFPSKPWFVDRVARAEFERLVDAQLALDPGPPLDVAHTLSWRKRMPETGISPEFK